MPNHQASEQMLGYLYQVRYALALLLENDNSDCQISIEKFDDVAFSKDDIPIQLIQLKHHIQHQGNLADASTDMWRTIPYFLGAINEEALALENERAVLKRTSIVNLDKSIANVTREQPKLRAFISTLEQERQKKQEEIRALEAEIDGIYQQEDERARLRDINARKGKVVGRISLWVESVQNDTESEQQEQVIREIEKRVQEIDSILDTDSVDERKQSALSRIQEDMTKWAKELQLEHCDNPYRLDLNKVTVIVDKPERPVPLKQLGSGSNWVGVHLIAYFALQHYFIVAKRPVPRFMFLDQPSQVYFPSEFDEKKTDWNEVNKIYQFVIDRTTELQGQLQVIIVDHADLKKDSFREFIRENWWPDDKNLVPIDWYKSE